MTREEIRELVRASRRAQGFSETVDDPRFLTELARDVAEAPTLELPRIGGGRHEAA